jgi:hypothetical protein
VPIADISQSAAPFIIESGRPKVAALGNWR